MAPTGGYRAEHVPDPEGSRPVSDPEQAPPALRQRRTAVVRAHFEAEAGQDFDTALATFDHPHYEIVPTGARYDGAEQVLDYYHSTRTAFPDQRHENVVLHHADDLVVAEFDLLGTHLGPLLGHPPTGRSFRCPVVAFFFFEGERITNERVYFDSVTILTQLGLVGPVPR